MEYFAALMEWTLKFFDYPITLYGFTFSLWQVFLFSAVICIIGRFLAEVFLGD